jgi:flavin-dependent dehydrogenase
MFLSRETKNYDALIIGGGPAGATAALLLSRAGWSVAVVERAAFPRRKVCGEFISATSLPLLFEIGAGGRFLDLAGPPVQRIGLYSSDTILTAPMPTASAPMGGWGRALGREHLDLLLLESAHHAGAHVWQPWRVISARKSGDRWISRIASETAIENLSAPVLIAAAGSWDRAQLSSTERASHRDSDLLAFKAHFRDFDLADDLMPLLAFPGGYGGIITTDDGRVSLSCCIRRDTLRRRRQAGNQRAGEAVLNHIARSCEGVRRGIRRARLEGAWLAAGPIRPGVRRPYSGGIFMSGNIAGEAHPIIAEGISMAMQSSWLLSRRLVAHGDDLVSGRGSGEIGSAYAADWYAAFTPRIHAAALFAFLATSPHAAALCRLLLRQIPQFLTFGARLSGKTRLIATQ